MATYIIKYKRTGSNNIAHTTVNASSASQAKEQLKSRYNGDVIIVSCVER